MGRAARAAPPAAPRRGVGRLGAIAVTTGILSGVWGWTAAVSGLPAWAGFLGCTSFFASPKDGVGGLAASVLTNLSGVFWALVILRGSEYAAVEGVGYAITAAVAFLMCIQATQAWLVHIPGTFIGACATFAAGGDWRIVVPALAVGGLFGYLMKTSGGWLHRTLAPDA